MLCAIRLFNVNYELHRMAKGKKQKKDWKDQIEHLWTTVIDVSACVFYMIMTLFMQNMVFQAQSIAELFHSLLLSLYAEKCLPFFLHSTQAHIFKQKYSKNVPEYVKTNRNGKTQRKPNWQRKRGKMGEKEKDYQKVLSHNLGRLCGHFIQSWLSWFDVNSMKFSSWFFFSIRSFVWSALQTLQ